MAQVYRVCLIPPSHLAGTACARCTAQTGGRQDSTRPLPRRRSMAQLPKDLLPTVRLPARSRPTSQASHHALGRCQGAWARRGRTGARCRPPAAQGSGCHRRGCLQQTPGRNGDRRNPVLSPGHGDRCDAYSPLRSQLGGLGSSILPYKKVSSLQRECGAKINTFIYVF